MSSEAQDPVTWLRAAILERKALAEAATQAAWEAEGDDPTDDEVWIDVDGDPWRMVICRGPQSHENMLHIAANDPRQVIADSEAQIAILDEHQPRKGWDGDRLDGQICGTCSWADRDGDIEGDPYPCRTVRLLLGGYRYRTGFDERWLAGTAG